MALAGREGTLRQAKEVASWTMQCAKTRMRMVIGLSFMSESCLKRSQNAYYRTSDKACCVQPASKQT